MIFRGPARPVIFWVLIFCMAFVGFKLLSDVGSEIAEITYSDFQRQLESNNLAEVKLIGRTIKGKLKESKSFPVGNTVRQFTEFSTILPFDDNNYLIINKLQAQNVKVSVEEPSEGYLGILFGIAPFLLIIFLWVFLMRQMQGGGGPKSIFSFGKSKARLVNDEGPTVTFDDVAGVEEAKEELREIIEFLANPGKFQKLGGKIPKGALLLGPPGTGKTLLARAVAGEAEVPFYSMSGSDFVEMFVGVGASRVRDLFEQGKKNAPCIIFIDEIDAVGRHRGAGLGGGHDEREQTLNQLLVEMDGFETNSGVILVAATNRPDVLDPALLRPGRFDRQIIVPLPDMRGREAILNVHAAKVKMSDDADMGPLARGTPGFSGADLANMINEAALMASRRGDNSVSMEVLEQSKDKVMMGAERKSMVITDKEKEMIAYHEAGHALVAKYIPEADRVYKVTIIPRGKALGVTSFLPEDERYTQSKSSLQARLAYALGGRVAEIIVFGEVTTGAGDDLERSTDLARRMVCQWGMSEKLGPVTFGKKEEQIFLGREFAQHQDYSEETARLIDFELRKIIETAEATATRIVTEHRAVLDKIAAELLEKEIIDGADIDKIIAETEGPKEPQSKPVSS
ncbi:MAG: ATP-dependent zinc metalloprotease FtsH [candidate division Zixibacteria bacterium]|nr:ATP-dependent zinc metalloprotease FtsH [candidate division Zixibacteria bacterium]